MEREGTEGLAPAAGGDADQLCAPTPPPSSPRGLQLQSLWIIPTTAATVRPTFSSSRMRAGLTRGCVCCGAGTYSHDDLRYVVEHRGDQPIIDEINAGTVLAHDQARLALAVLPW